MPGVVEVLDALAQAADALGDPRPVDRQPVVGPVQVALAVQEGEQELAAEAVVVADPRAGDREAEEAVEEDRVLDVAGEGEALALELDRGGERGQVAAQLLERVHPVRAALADHERVEGQVAAHVGAVVDQVPEHVGGLGELARGEQAGGVRGQVEAQDLGRGAADAAEALGLAVAEDRAEVVVGGTLGGREGLGEEDRALGVVAGGAVDEGDREELRVVEAGRLELGDPVGPGDADDQRLEAGVGGGVLLVHREDGEVLDPVAAVALGAEGLERAVEGGLAEAGVGPGERVGARARRCSPPGGGSAASAPAPTRRSRRRGCAACSGSCADGVDRAVGRLGRGGAPRPRP